MGSLYSIGWKWQGTHSWQRKKRNSTVAQKDKGMQFIYEPTVTGVLRMADEGNFIDHSKFSAFLVGGEWVISGYHSVSLDALSSAGDL